LPPGRDELENRAKHPATVGVRKEGSMQSEPAQDTSGVVMVGEKETRSLAQPDLAAFEKSSMAALNEEETPLQVTENIPPLVNDAIRLILYLTGEGDPPRPEIISSVLAAQKAVEQKSWSIERNRRFFEAFSELAKQAKPVTAKSLIESEGPHAKSSIRRWSLVVWVLLPILVFLSALSFAHSRFSANLDQLIQDSYRVEEPGYMPPIPRASDAGMPRTPASDGLTTENDQLRKAMAVQAHIDTVRDITAQMISNATILLWMSFTAPLTEVSWSEIVKLYHSDTSDEAKSVSEDFDIAKNNINIQIATLRLARTQSKVIMAMGGIIYGILSTYILPLLCALLGAAAYGLRSLSEQTLSRTYHSSYSAYARAILAVIVGFAVGLFSEFTAKLSLQPLAAAFLAGYAVESFFIFLDTILQAVQKPRGAATST
jgi:hypothetical protein